MSTQERRERFEDKFLEKNVRHGFFTFRGLIVEEAEDETKLIDDILSFIDHEVEEAVREERERIRETIIKLSEKRYDEENESGPFYEALTQVLSLLSQDTSHE